MTDRSDISVILSFFSNEHKKKFGAPYMPSYGKDQNIIKQIIGTYGLTKTTSMIESFFIKLDTDEFLQKTGATIGIFKTQIPKLVMDGAQEKKDNQIGKL